jgi:hypothetical protein
MLRLREALLIVLLAVVLNQSVTFAAEKYKEVYLHAGDSVVVACGDGGP